MMRKYRLIGFLVILAAMSVSSTSFAQEKFPPSWRKTMTNDPATNPLLAKFSQKLDDPFAEQTREMLLVSILGKTCEGVVLNKQVFQAVNKKWNWLGHSEEQQTQAKFDAEYALSGFGYKEMAHLCASIDYLFGKNGIFVANLMRKGDGEPIDNYDDVNPYIKLPDLKVKSIFRAR